MSNRVTHAFVRYLDDNEKMIVKSSDVKAFDPETVNDYDAIKKYKVLWYDKRTKKSHYYNASILLLGTSKKDVELKIKQMEENAKRYRTSPPETLSSPSNSETSSSDEEPQTKKQKKENLKTKVDFHCKNSLENDTLNSERSFQSNEPKNTLDLMNNRIEELKNQVQLLENDNKILKMDMIIVKQELNDGKQELNKRRNFINDKDEKLVNVPISYDNEESIGNNHDSVITEAPLVYDNKSSNKTSDDAAIETILENDEAQSNSSKITKSSLPQSSYNRYEKLMTVDTISGNKVEKIYLDENILVNSESWDSIKCQKDDSKFVKNLAQAIWTRYELVNRSLDGSGTSRILNRSPRKKLTPKKRNLLEECFKDRLKKQQPDLGEKALEKVVKGSGKYLTELINDLIKREKKNSQK